MSLYMPSAAAQAASDYFNSLPREERAKLAPLLEHYRQMGLAEAYDHHQTESKRIRKRISGIREMFGPGERP